MLNSLAESTSPPTAPALAGYTVISTTTIQSNPMESKQNPPAPSTPPQTELPEENQTEAQTQEPEITSTL